jgi:hypothetical protein
LSQLHEAGDGSSGVLIRNLSWPFSLSGLIVWQSSDANAKVWTWMD